MIKEELQKRIITIKNELSQHRAGITKLEGHLAEANHWLASIFKSELEDCEGLTSENTDQSPLENP